MSDDELVPLLSETPEPVQPSQEPTVDAGSPKVYRRRKRDAEIDQRENDNFWRRALADPVGRRELYRFIASCGTFSTPFACGPNGFPQPEATWFKAGEKATGQRFFDSLVVLDRVNFYKMLDECDPRFARREAKAKES